jgi:hypothetical protein
MYELVANLHMHTSFSDGSGTHADIARAALTAGIDVVIVTDHNVLVAGPEEIYRDGDRRVLLLIGEEIHDQARQPQKNHLLVFGANRELASYASDPQYLIETVRQADGCAFIAHPVDPAAPAFNEPDISWLSWDIQGITGIELWNGMSEFKSLLKTRFHAIYYAFNPASVAHGPFPDTLRRWDELLNAGKKIAAVGGSDAHAFKVSMGPLRRILFPYEFHFRAINTHLLTQRPLNDDLAADRQIVLEALAGGSAFIGYDLPASTRGFRFSAQGKDQVAQMGETISARYGVTFQIRLPYPAECLLIKNGKAIKTWHKRDTCTHITSETGVYRVEVYLHFRGKRRGWIFSNPIYLE